MIITFLLILAMWLSQPKNTMAQMPDEKQQIIRNPILPGFHPDPTICRVDSDYYICNSSFTWYPGLPIYHSKDLMNWQLVGHAIDRPGMVTLEGVKDKDGIWAPTLRHHDGYFYLFCNISNAGNFFLKSKSFTGPWSDPVWIKDAPGIDPDIFWDDDGKSYLLANQWGLKDERYKGKCVIWIQEIDLNSGRLLGERSYLTTGHASNAKGTEGAHLYKVGGRYALLTAEGGTDFNHAVTIHWSNKILGPYTPQQINPVLTHRHLGHKAEVQCVGHADIVQTVDGKWYAVCLGKRMIDGHYTFTRETFLCPVELQQNEFVFNAGNGKLPETIACQANPVRQQTKNDQWYFERIPHTDFLTRHENLFELSLQPETLDSLTSPALVMQKVTEHKFNFTSEIDFQPRKDNEVAGIVLHRNVKAYISLVKMKDSLQLICRDYKEKRTICSVPYKHKRLVLRLVADGINASCYYGGDIEDLKPMSTFSLIPLTDNKQLNRFNGVGIGFYASSNGKKSKAKAIFRILSDSM